MTKWICMSAILFLSGNAGAAPLIINGGFEDLGGNTVSGDWSYFASLPGWSGVNNIEVQKDGFLANGFGDYYIELNAHPGQNIPFQLQSDSFSTVLGQAYLLSFFAQRRRADDGEFSFMVDGYSQSVSSHVTSGFTLFTYNFIGTGSLTNLVFTSGQSGSDTIGHFLDNVSLTTVSSVPEPGMLALLLTGMMGIGLSRCHGCLKKVSVLSHKHS
ncbi:MAG: PEP-CTERM sorting domain-containing protein [Gammaproteobacteria bacterium]|nr:PEP-CTERM sorting domain-containing protein [Pseudomonadales bacterium]MCP5348732.1 PEP-CTERM sorting domain-containing protein [Pseudomonadales bacterium]